MISPGLNVKFGFRHLLVEPPPRPEPRRMETAFGFTLVEDDNVPPGCVVLRDRDTDRVVGAFRVAPEGMEGQE